MPSNITLYHYWRSSCSWRVRWALNIKKIPYKLKHVNLLTKEQESPAYKKMNPSGALPWLEVNGQSFGESLAIIEWLEEVHPGNPLLPSDPSSRLHSRQLAYTISSGTQPLQNLSAQKYHSPDKDKQSEYARFWIEKGLATYEKILSQVNHGTYSLGAQVTVADLCLIPQCYNAERFGVDLNLFPISKGIYTRALKTEACEKAAPHNFEPK